MIEDYDGATVLDTAGEKIGTVERSYMDDRGMTRFVEVKMGGFRAKHRLVPMDQLERTDDGIKVPYGKDVVVASPDASPAGDTLEGEMLDEVRAYYASGPGGTGATTDAVEEAAAVPVNESESHDTSGSGSDHGEGMGDKVKKAVEQIRGKLPGGSSEGTAQDQSVAGETGQVRDLGDVIEVPIIEERLVKTPVVKEVLRIRKRSVPEQRSVSAELRKEDIEVDTGGDARGDVKQS